jgi:hypothetical protein
MTGDFSFHVRWLERLHGSPAEREAFGELEIRSGGLVLTELADLFAMTVRPAARVCLLRLGTWLAANWWRLRWEPLPGNPDADWRVAHRIGGAGGGYAWPDLQFAADGETIALSLRETLEAGPPVRYLHRFDGSIEAVAFERAVDDVMAVLLERLSARRADAGDLAAAWHEVSAERSDPGATVRRRREALLGLDPDAIPDDELAAVTAAGAWLGDAALEETMAAARASGIESALGALAAWRDRPAAELDLTGMLAARRAWLATPRAFARPWERGAALARLARGEVGLAPDEPVPNDRLASLLGHDVASSRTDGGAIAAGFRAADSPSRLKFHGIRRHPNGRRFEAARIVAEFLDGPTGDTVLPITDAATARQKIQRSFAQEFLCPVEALAGMLTLPAPADAEMEAAADHFGVSEFTVRSALVNREMLDRRFLPWCRGG